MMNQEIPPKVGDSLTEFGRTAASILEALCKRVRVKVTK
jgi:DNA-binding HxlR family transcriptional regulator